MDRFLAKSLILFLLLASLSGATFLSREANAGSRPEAIAEAMNLCSGVARLGQGLSGPSELHQYTARGHVLGFREDGVIIASGSHSLRVEFVNTRTVPPAEEGASSGPAEGQGGAPALGKVTYRDLWDGVTLIYEKTPSGVVESTYLIQPGEARASNPVDEIRLRYNVPVKINGNGDLMLSFATGEMQETRPVAWQEVEGRRRPVEAGYRLLGEQEIGLKVKAYDPRYPLVIDPVLSWSTFLGGLTEDRGTDIAVDTNGNVYVTGYCDDTWGSPIRPFSGGYDTFVAKVNANGVLLWNTFLGGGLSTEATTGAGIATDESGNVYVTGWSNTTWGSPINPQAGDWDIFVAKLDTDGVLQWNTFLGGNNTDYGQEIAIDKSGNVYLTGYSYATWGSPVESYHGGFDIIVAMLDANGTLQWNTFLGQSEFDQGYGIALDTNGNCYITGESGATWGLPITSFAGGYDAFVAKLDTTGSLQWNTFLGGSGSDGGSDIAVDTNGNSYVTGTSSATWGLPVRAYGWYDDAFVARLDTDGALQWNTFLGGSATDSGNGIVKDTSGIIYVVGSSMATWGLPINPYSGGYDAFIAKLDGNGALKLNTFLGGAGSDYGNGLAGSVNESVYVAGYSRRAWGSPINPYAGGIDAFVAKVSFAPRVDFNGDGQEDILWRYYGTGGYNRAWFLGNTEQAGLAFSGVSPQIAGGSATQSSVNKARGKTIGNDRAMGMLANRPKKSPLKGGQDVMGRMNRRGAGVGVVDDPRKAGGVYPKASPMSVADPRSVKLTVTPEASPDQLALTASTPVLLGGGDLLPVGDVYWWIVGMADFNNDSHVDILWRNMSSGSNVVWFMNGTEWTGSTELLPVGDLYWEIVGTGDFNNDGHADILWRNVADGSNVIWYMDGTTWIGSAVLLGVSDLAWEIAGTGDFNNDGHVDILWRYNQYGGYNVVWYMNDAAWIGSVELISVGDLSWEIASTGDYNSDGKIDILWRYMWTGSPYIWYMDGVTWIGGGDLLQVPDTTWKLVPGCRIW